ncbi:hypothetical protein ACQ4PT_045199 [Festuca glaucescens]
MDELNNQMDRPAAVLKAIKFDLMTSTDMERVSSATIIDSSDVTSAKLGLPNGAPQCETCGAQNVRGCDGHSGAMKLPATVLSPYFIEEVARLLNQICPGCHTPKQNRDSKKSDSATSQATCKYCSKDGAKLYPSVIFKTLKSPRIILSRKKFQRNPAVMDKVSITAEVADRVTNKFKNNGSPEVLPHDYWDFLPHHQPPQSNTTRILLSPHQVFHMLKQLDPDLIHKFASRRALLFLSCLPVTPNCHRVAEMPYGFSDGPRLTYDDLTKAYKRTVDVSRKVDDYRQYPQFNLLASSLVTSRVMDCLKSSKLHSKKTDNESSTGLANFFSENADVPGTLTRKLMYHLRDTYVAYDGTVRSSYGQQITQFTYGTAENMYTDGAPVGSWAAGSISEAAYGALDHPVNSLEDSPLMNLQDVLKCQKGANSLDHFGLLFLSKNLKKYRYGPEYASLEVKDHLEPVKFSDLVETVMILYDGHGVQTAKESPWITHFHISKEMMKRKKLGLRFVVDELTEQYDSKGYQSSSMFPQVYISKGSKGSAGNEKCFNDQTCCITVVTEDDSNSTSQLDTIKKRVIPKLLSMLVKGFLEFKDVEIQCQQDNELVVKVGMSEHCKSGEFWADLQNACVAIMELIDWERSRPGSVYDISCSYGIDSAWNFFVESLRSKTDDIGKNIHREHLLVVADSLSVSGQFHGLSSQGLKQQRTRLSVSSPFSEACFSRPAQSFINAAKQCSVDNLCGTVDAMAWGKEPFAGTSGPFEIIYSGKAHEPLQNENIYDILHNAEVRDAAISNGGGTISEEQDFLSARVGTWDNIIDMRTCLQNMLIEYKLNEYVTELDKSRIIEALRFHPRGHEKIGAGIRDIKIGHHPSHPGTRCFLLVRDDNTTEDFSYRKCVQEAANSISPQLGSYVKKILQNRAV